MYAYLASPYTVMAHALHLLRRELRKDILRDMSQATGRKVKDYDVEIETVETLPYKVTDTTVPVLAYYDDEKGFTVKVLSQHGVEYMVRKMPGAKWVPLVDTASVYIFTPTPTDENTLDLDPRPRQLVVARLVPRP